MTAKKNPKPDDREQSKRFLETAKQVEAEDKEALEQAFKTIASRKKDQKS